MDFCLAGGHLLAMLVLHPQGKERHHAPLLGWVDGLDDTTARQHIGLMRE